MKNYFFYIKNFNIQNYLLKIKNLNIKNNFLNFRKKNPFSAIILVISIVFLFLLYFSIPSFYNYEDYEKQIQKKVSKDFKLNLKNISNITYLMLPSPHFLIEECDVYFSSNPDEKILSAKHLKINVLSKNLHKKEKIEFKNIYLNKSDLDIEFIDLKNFYNHLKNSNPKPIYFNNSNLFFRDKKKEIISISKIKKFEYFFDSQNDTKALNIDGNLFGSNFKFNWKKNFLDSNISESKIKFSNPNIVITSKFDDINKNSVSAQTNINFLRNDLYLNYKLNNKNIELIDDKIKKLNQSKLIGNINLNPFFFDLNLILSGIKIETVLNNVFLNLYNLNKSSHLNFNGNLKINLNEVNNRLFENLVLNINFLEEKINLNKSSLILKKIGKINFSDPNIYEKNQKIYVNSKITFDVYDQQELYKRFLIPRQNRIDLKKVFFELEYNIDEGNYYLSDINFTERDQQTDNFYEINNFQQLNTVISKVFKKISLD